MVIASLLPLYPGLGHQLHAPGRRVAIPDPGEAAGRIEPGRHVLADGTHRPRHPRATAGRDRHAVVPRRRWRRLRPDQRRQPVRPLDADRRARVHATGADRSRAPAGPALPAVSGDLHPGGGRARRAERPRCADSVRAGRTGPAEARPVHRAGTAAALQERRARRRRPHLSARPAGAAAEHRPQARRRSRRARAGRLADGQRPRRRPEGHDVQCGLGPVRRGAARAGFVPPDA